MAQSTEDKVYAGLAEVLRSTKPTNPKDAVGIGKVPLSAVPSEVMMEVGLGMMEGARKYGRHNFRVPALGVRASVYYDATLRHLMDWWEGEDIDPDSGLSHVTKAITSLVVLRDAMIHTNWRDDRPPKSPEGWMQEFNKKAAALLDKYPNPVEAYTHDRVQKGSPEAEASYASQEPQGQGLDPIRILSKQEALELLEGGSSVPRGGLGRVGRSGEAY